MNNKSEKVYIATAFISSSLRSEDFPFVDHVESILEQFNIKPVGTVGKYSAAPENPSVSMKNNIPNTDFIVIVATPRYFQKDLQTEKISYSISEQLHVEAGIAYANNIPVMAFVQEGTEIGKFLPSITQYITLNGTMQDYLTKEPLIVDLLNKTYNKVQELKGNKNLKNIFKIGVYGLAAYGLYKLLVRDSRR